jgi:hypothetical protein
MLIAIAVVLVGIFFVATGRGGELAYEQADHAPLDLGPVSAADIALLRPPSAMWGYNMQVTDAALDQIARAMRERDVTIAYLQDQLASAQRNGAYDEPRGAHARPFAVSPPGLVALEGAGERGALALSEDQVPLAPFEGQAPLVPFEAEEAPEADAAEELADPEPLEPLEASGSRTSEASAAEAGPADTRPEQVLSEEALPEEVLPAQTDPAEAWHAAQTDPAEAWHAAQTDPAEARPAAEVPTFTPTATYRQTPLVLKASGPKLPSSPEPREVTQPSLVREAAEEPEAHGPTQPNASLSPQGSFDTHDWWAEQTEAAQKERARRQAAGETDLDTEEEAEQFGRPDGDPLAAEEQGW